MLFHGSIFSRMRLTVTLHVHWLSCAFSKEQRNLQLRIANWFTDFLVILMITLGEEKLRIGTSGGE